MRNRLPSLVWVGLIQSVEGLNGTKRQSKRQFSRLIYLQDGTVVFSCLWTQTHNGTYTSTLLILRPWDIDWPYLISSSGSLACWLLILSLYMSYFLIISLPSPLSLSLTLSLSLPLLLVLFLWRAQPNTAHSHTISECFISNSLDFHTAIQQLEIVAIELLSNHWFLLCEEVVIFLLWKLLLNSAYHSSTKDLR